MKETRTEDPTKIGYLELLCFDYRKKSLNMDDFLTSHSIALALKATTDLLTVKDLKKTENKNTTKMNLP